MRPDREQRKTLWTLVAIFVVAVVLNYVWELAQSFLYVRPDTLTALWHCFLASLGDGLVVLFIFALGRIVLRRRDWFAHPGVSGYALMGTAGLLISIGIEFAARWTYTSRMPLLPWLNIGVVPIIQMLVLPPLIFRVATWASHT